MSTNRELDYALIAHRNGLLSLEQFEGVKAIWKANPERSMLGLLRDQFGIDPSSFALDETIADTISSAEGASDTIAAGNGQGSPIDLAATIGEPIEVLKHGPLPSMKAEKPRIASQSFAMGSDAGTIDLPPAVSVEFLPGATLGDSDFSRTLLQDSETLGDVPTRETVSPAGVRNAPGHVRVSQLNTNQGNTTRERYTLTRLHARGGIGQVWLAHDTALGREVALKELRPEQSPSDNAKARFLEEAQITGQLEHPGIVPVYELKKSPDDDRPFYTMRFIRGGTLEQAIRDYHEKRRRGEVTPLDRAALLNAFVGACNAIDYAHSRGVIHRDLKGQNVVLGDYGEVMVLDWGLAKVIGTPDGATAPEISFDENDPTHHPTMHGQIQGTPAYMAPEQAEGRISDIDARTDVYGLGAILYEILSGQPPFTGSTTHELLQRVSHSQPPSPRTVDPTVPTALLSICAKAIAKRPEDRYPSARELAMDVKRWLADEPVSAYKEPWTIRLNRWVKRHKSGVAAAATILVMTTAVLGVTSILIRIERDEARRQRQQARLAVDDMYSKVADQWLEDRLDPLQTEFLNKALAYYESFTQDDSREPVVRQERGRAYLRMGDALRKLGSHERADEAYRKAIETLGALVKDEGKAGEPGFHLAHAETRLASSLAERGKVAEAEPIYRQAATRLQTLESAAPQTAQKLQLARTQRELGDLLRTIGKPAESEQSYLAAQTLLEPLGTNPAQVESRRELAAVEDRLGLLFRETSRPVEAEQLYSKSAALLEQLLSETPTLPNLRVELAKVYNSIGLLMRDTGRVGESETVLRRQVALNERLTEDFPDRPNDRRALARSLINLAVLLRDKGDARAAEDTYQKALVINQKLSAEFSDVPIYRRDQARCLNNIGELMAARSKFDDALTMYSKALALYEQLAKEAPTVPSYRYMIAVANLNMANVYQSTARPSQMDGSYRQAIDLLTSLVTEFPNNPDYLRTEANCLGNYGNGLAAIKKYEPAEQNYQKATEIFDRLITQKLAGPSDRLEFSRLLSNRGVNLQENKRPEAEAVLARSVSLGAELVKEFPQVNSYQQTLAIANVNQGEFLASAGKLKEAETAYNKAISLYETLTKAEPKNSVYPTEFAMTLGDLAKLRTEEKRVADARGLLERAVGLQKTAVAINPRSNPTRLSLQTQLKSLAETLVVMGDHSTAAKTTEEFVKVVPEASGVNQEAARLLTRCVTLITNDSTLPAEKRTAISGVYADRAISLLRDAIQRGEIAVEQIQKDERFAPLHSREAFKSLAAVAPVKVARLDD